MVNESRYSDMDSGEVRALVRGSLDMMYMRESVEEITARGRGLRRRRRALASAAAVGVLGTGLAIGLPVSAPGSGGRQTLSANGQAVNVDVAAWSVHTGADSTVLLTVRQVVNDPQQLREVLAKAGVRALVLDEPRSVPCPAGTRVTSLPFGQVFTVPPHTSAGQMAVIHPSAMPPGSVLEIAIRQRGNEIDMSLLSSDPGNCDATVG